MVDTDNDNRIELAFALATYLAKYPAPQYSLESRIALLTGHWGEAVDETLLRETEYWLAQLAGAEP